MTFILNFLAKISKLVPFLKEMNSTEVISHQGVVTKSDGDGVVEVVINAGTACSACHAKSACGMGSETEKIIRVNTDRHFRTGENVTVTMEQHQGLLAVVIGYVLPLIVLIAAFIIFTMLGLGELFTCLLSFAALGACYLIIWMLRGRIEQKFTFKIKD